MLQDRKTECCSAGKRKMLQIEGGCDLQRGIYANVAVQDAVQVFVLAQLRLPAGLTFGGSRRMRSEVSAHAGTPPLYVMAWPLTWKPSNAPI